MTEKERRLARDLGNSIRAHRKRHGWSQADLAEQLGVSVDFVGMLERGLRLPALPALLRLSALFGASLDELVHDEQSDELREATALLRTIEPERLKLVVAMLRGLITGTRETRTPGRRRGSVHS